MKLNITLFNHLSLLEKSVLTRHLSIMLRAGVPLTEALQTLAEQERNEGHRTMLLQIQNAVESGHSLREGLAKTKQFDTFYLSMIDVGESSGTLVENLTYLSRHLSREYELRQKVMGAMMYPALVMAAMFILSMIISLFILPQLVTFFEAFDTDLPITTKILLWFANFMKNYGIVFFISLFLGMSGFLSLMQQKAIKPYWHAFLLKVPLFGKIMSLYQQARFARNMSILLKSGVPIAQALGTSSNTLSNLVFQKYVETLTKLMIKGRTMTQVIAQHRLDEFSPLLQRMIAIGEKTGNLPETLEYVGGFFEEEIEYAQKNLTTLLEPALLLVIGFLVGFVALAIIGPIYQLTGSLNQGG